jgi:hypothetical protein
MTDGSPRTSVDSGAAMGIADEGERRGLASMTRRLAAHQRRWAASRTPRAGARTEHDLPSSSLRER